MSDKPHMHIYGQDHWHDDAHIVANEEALLLLRKAIDDALTKGHGYVPVYAGDGEGYNTLVAKVDNTQDFETLAVAYTCETAKENRKEAVWPWDLTRIWEAETDSQEFSKEEADIKKAIADDKERRDLKL